jgi:hypothetical protein
MKKESEIVEADSHILSGWTQFNLNHYVLVKPNKFGKDAFIKSWELTMSREKAEQYYESLLDKEGRMKLQLWVAMEYFGESMRVWLGGLNADEFYLETKWLKDCDLKQNTP